MVAAAAVVLAHKAAENTDGKHAIAAEGSCEQRPDDLYG